MEKLMFSRTNTERLCAVSTKNTTIPSRSNTNVVLMPAVKNCMSNTLTFPLRLMDDLLPFSVPPDGAIVF